MNREIILRPERTEDQEFLSSLYASTRTAELERVPWSEVQKEAFLKMQFVMQTKHYHQYYLDAAYQIVLLGTKPIGRLYVHRDQDHILVIDIALLPEYRGAGIGSQLMTGVMLEAAAVGKPVRIHVEFENPAIRLYTRLGFRLLEKKGIYYLMEWNAQGGAGIAGLAQ